MLDFAFVRRSGSGKTNVWNVTVTATRILGTIAWRPNWSCYVFTPTINESLRAEHLEKIVAFMRSEAASAPAVGSAKRPVRAVDTDVQVRAPASVEPIGEWTLGKRARRLKWRRLGSVGTA